MIHIHTVACVCVCACVRACTDWSINLHREKAESLFKFLSIETQLYSPAAAKHICYNLPDSWETPETKKSLNLKKRSLKDHSCDWTLLQHADKSSESCTVKRDPETHDTHCLCEGTRLVQHPVHNRLWSLNCLFLDRSRTSRTDSTVRVTVSQTVNQLLGAKMEKHWC